MFSKHRLEALSDGIFAIVMTLLVLDLKVPDGQLPPHFGVMLAQQWLSFGITFVIAAIFWTLQHRLFDLLEGVQKHTLIPTFVFLGFVSVLPFSTSLLGHRLGERVGFIVYYSNQFLIAGALTVKLLLAMRTRQVAASPEAHILRDRLVSMCAVMAAGVVSASFVPLRFNYLLSVAVAVAAKKWRHYNQQKAAAALVATPTAASL